MDMYQKGIGQEKRESLELAEASREAEWNYPSFTRELYHGSLPWGLIHPFPRQTEEDKKIGADYMDRLKAFLTANLNPDEVDITGEIPPAVIKGLGELGALALKIPKEYEGLGLSQVNYNRIVHMVASYCGSTAVLMSAHQSIGVPLPLTLFGTEEQKKKFLPLFRRGAVSGFALTEPGAGSDPRTMKTTATPTQDGQHYLINGEKLWCTNGNIADILVVMCQTPPKTERGKEKKQITAFIVDTKTPGFEVAYRCRFMGLHGAKLGLLKFNNVKVPRENMLAGEGQGLKLALNTLNTGRLTVPAAVTGMCKWALMVARRWSLERKQWGVSIGEHQAVATKLAGMAATTFAMDAVTWLTSHMAQDKKLDIRLEAAIAKLFCTESSWRVIDDAFQIRAGRGFETGPSLKGRGETGYAVERMFRDARVNLIIEGTSQIMRLFIAREAMDPHLRRLMAPLSPKLSIAERLKAAVGAGLYYALWYPALWLPCGAPAGAGDLPPALRGHAAFARRASKRLGRTIFHKMAIYQQKLESKQNLLARLVDVGVELFVTSATCAYAAALAKEGTAEAAESPVELADLFCRMSRRRVKALFSETCCNDDKVSSSLAKKLLAGRYEWMENDIIK